MSANIKLSEVAIWWTSSLFLSKLAEHIRAVYPEHAEVHEIMEAATLIGGFTVDGYEPELAALAARMLYTVAKDTSAGIIQPGPIFNPRGDDLQDAFLRSLADLVTVFELDGRNARRW